MSDASADSAAKPNYKKTILRPQTPFSMKANLVQNEPASIKRWDRLGVYDKLREKRAGAEPFVFHDGPPYANGNIHLGHLLNKVLKDLVVRSQSMLGKDCPYTPGWDCHGLPIEHKVMQGLIDEMGEAAKAMEPIKVRRKCKAYAEKFVKTQKGQMQRLLTMADYDDPYLTMLPKYEAGVLEVFAGMVEAGLVYRQLKPVHWSVENRTALADAELEYYDREDTSVYVLFEVHGGQPGEHLMIWTTTPWTLPANLAVAVSPRAEYGQYDLGGGRSAWVACDLAEKVLGLGGVAAGKPSRVVRGDELVGKRYEHPFVQKTIAAANDPYRVVTAEYVTLEDGTGMVHTAPGHGVEDWQTGIRESLGVYCPVLPDGTFDETAPEWLVGQSIWDGNERVVDRLRESGLLFHSNRFMHSYPHDWRGKTPVIFRATEQWFVGVDTPMGASDAAKANAAQDEANDPFAKSLAKLLGEKSEPAPEPDAIPGPDGPLHTLRERALRETAEDIDFLPAWGRNRMRGMLEGRPDWCVSRQRSWGLPIPAFFKQGDAKAEPLLTPASVLAVAELIREKGSDAWYTMSADELLLYYDPVVDDHAPSWCQTAIDLMSLDKGGDTFDVWFESGSSWNACISKGWRDKQAGLAVADDALIPTDLYLEGSDQHRGWFQHSLLPALAVTGRPPFKRVLTHGFMVTKDGQKMSKSLGNAVEVEDLMTKFGADVARWWVCSLNTDNDIKVDWSYFEHAGEEYRKVRNTLRFLLGNLGDFDPAEHTHEFTEADAMSLDAWALAEFDALVIGVRSRCERFEYRAISRALFNFCNETLSAVYLTATKDRLYCDAADSPRRRRTQTAMRAIASGLIRLLAPVCPHTADEAWLALHGEIAKDSERCVHLEAFPEPTGVAWSRTMAEIVNEFRVTALGDLEKYRQANGIENPMDLGVRMGFDRAWLDEGIDAVDLADMLGISRFTHDASVGFTVDDLCEEPRCERSWKRDGTVRERSDGGTLSDRDAAVLGVG
ncbi:MAG: isoleucine--tRNA ligase [Planctomycetota bacterium]